jgi:transposase InsO family protein
MGARGGGSSGCSATTAASSRAASSATRSSWLGARKTHIHAGRPQTNGNVEALHRTILDECWRPAFARYLYVRLTGLRRELETYLDFYNNDRVHHGRLTAGRIPADTSTVLARWRRDEARVSPHLGGGAG